MGGHAVVIGGSVAGLMAARVLVDHFDAVTVLERDVLPEGAEHRAGVPQARHAHALMKRGQQVLDGMFPGLTAEVLAAGGCTAKVGSEFRVYSRAGWLADTDYEMLQCGRTLLESVIRRRVRGLARVTIVEGTRVIDLLSATPGAVTGVRHAPRDGAEQELAADLVVDASGRTSKASEWLVKLGYAAPPVEEVDARVGYASRLYRPAPGWSAPWRGILVQPAPPDEPCGGGVLQVEGGLLLVSAYGGSGRYAPTDEEGFAAFVRGLRTPEIDLCLRGAAPVSAIHGFRDLVDRMRRFERMPRRPDNLLVTGDAVCTFNPVYGQGISVAAIGAELLRECLDAQPRARAGLRGLATRYQRALAVRLQHPWSMATSEDMRFAGVAGAGGARTRWLHWYIDRLLKLAVCRPEVSRVFMAVVHMLAPPASLLRPDIVAAVLFDRAARAPVTVPR